jgi:ornithine cyclodeaminase/alanine dehydrogenase
MQNRLLYLSRADVEAVALPVLRIIELLETVFREKGHARVEMPPKPGIHPAGDAFIHAMPAFIPSLSAAGIKWVSGYPSNPGVGLPYINGLVILNDPQTGLPVAVMDCTWITAWRTAAATALAARYLARPDSQSVGILACGVQGRTNLEALASLFPLVLAYAYDTGIAARQRFIREMSPKLGIEIIAVDQPDQAVTKSDIVVTSGPILIHPEPAIQPGWLQPGSFASALDFDSYWHPAALRQFDKLCTDDLSQFLYYQGLGYFKGGLLPYADLGEIVTGVKPGRQDSGERTMAMNLGLAINDIAVAAEIYRQATERRVGTWLSL